MTPHITEDDIEEATLAWFSDLGYSVLYGPDIAPIEEGAAGSERGSYADVVLHDRILGAQPNE